MKRLRQLILLLLPVSGSAFALTEEIAKLPSKDGSVQPCLLSVE